MRACPYNIIIIIIILNNLFAIMGRTRFFGLVACLPWVFCAHNYRPTAVRRRRTIIYSSTTEDVSIPIDTYGMQSGRNREDVHIKPIICALFFPSVFAVVHMGTAVGGRAEECEKTIVLGAKFQLVHYDIKILRDTIII